MYKIAIQTFGRNYLLFLLFAVVMTAISTTGIIAGIGVSLIAYCLLALCSHRMVLLDEHYSWASFPGGSKHHAKPAIVRFSIMYIAFVALNAAFVHGLFWVLIAMGPESGAGGARGLQLLSAICVALIISGTILVLLGTAFPAAATGGDTSMSAALHRGRARFLQTIARLLLGPALFAFFGLLVLLALINNFGSSLSTSFVGHFLGLIVTHLAAIALSLAYQET